MSFYRLLVRYLSFVLLPMVVLLTLAELLLENRFEVNYTQKLQDKLDFAQSQVQFSLDMVDGMCVSIDKTNTIVSSLLDVNAYSRVNVCNLLRSYSILNTLYTDLYLFSTQTPELYYSPRGTDLLKNLSVYNCFSVGESPVEQLRTLKERHLYSDLIASDAEPLMVSQLRHKHSWLYACPASVFSNSSVNVLLCIDTQNFYSMYADVFDAYGAEDYAMVTLNRSGDIIGIFGELMDDEEILAPSMLGDGLPSGKYAVLRTEHENFTNLFFLNSGVIAAAIRPQRNTVHWICLSALVFAAGVCVIIARQAYRPIALLRDSILTGMSRMPIDHSEYQSIDQSIADIILTYNRREEQSRHILDMTRKQLIYWALLNNLPHTEHTEQLLNLTGFTQPNMLFCVLSIQLPSDADSSLIDGLCADICRTDWKHGDAVTIWVPVHDTIAVVFHMFVELDTRASQEYAANTLRLILDQYNIQSTIGIGISQLSLYTLNRSYVTARRAADKSDASYCLFEDVVRANESDQFSSCLSALAAQINAGNTEAARAELARYLEMLSTLNDKRALFQFHTSLLLNEMSHFLVDMGLWNSSELDNEIERLMFMNPEEREESLGILLDQITVNAPAENPASPSSAKESILARVHDDLVLNALDPMLNINLEAEKYGMSTVTLNRRFRQYYGCTMVNFVSEIRIEKAKELLRTSDMRIKDIVTAVGYFDVPNFSRKFKTVVGLTPGQYRQQERSGTVSEEEPD